MEIDLLVFVYELYSTEDCPWRSYPRAAPTTQSSVYTPQEASLLGWRNRDQHHPLWLHWTFLEYIQQRAISLVFSSHGALGSWEQQQSGSRGNF